VFLNVNKIKHLTETCDTGSAGGRDLSFYPLIEIWLMIKLNYFVTLLLIFVVTLLLMHVCSYSSHCLLSDLICSYFLVSVFLFAYYYLKYFVSCSCSASVIGLTAAVPTQES
jgi:hypothetical protein